MRLKPGAKLFFIAVAVIAGVFTLHMATPTVITAGTNVTAKAETWAWNAQSGTRSNGNDAVLRDGDWNIAERQRRVVLNDDLTGFAPLDKALQFAWAHCGALLLIFGFLAFISIAASNSEVRITHRDGVHPKCENMRWAGGGYFDGEEPRKRLRVGYVSDGGADFAIQQMQHVMMDTTNTTIMNMNNNL
jgi:hypothetical protein